jgi:hypothetical protein
VLARWVWRLIIAQIGDSRLTATWRGIAEEVRLLAEAHRLLAEGEYDDA